MKPDREMTVELRRRMRERLAAWNPTEKSAAWSEIQGRLERDWLPSLTGDRLTLALFAPMKDEFPILEFASVLEARFSKGLTLLFPRIGLGSLPLLEFHECRTSELLPGGAPWGIAEPPPASPRMDLNEADWVWVPGLVFGEQGERIGRGKGFYDRALAAAPGPKRLALAADFQVLPELPQHEGDARMDWIVTDERLILPACASRQNRA